MNHRILVKVVATEKFLSFRTIMKDKKSPHSFMISKGVVGDLYDIPDSVVCVYDSGSFAQLWRDVQRRTVHIRFCWLQSVGCRLVGWEQTIIMPFSELMLCSRACDGKWWAFLSMEQPPFPKLVFHAENNLHAAVNNPAVRRKLSRFLRDNFQWRNSDEICFYDDYEPYSFFFREIQGGNVGICGGVILHDQDDMEKARYTLHT